MNCRTHPAQRLVSWFAALIASAVTASAVVFTIDTTINPTNSNYDGQDIIVSNATLTVDGPHTFASLIITSNSVLTHTFSTNGILPDTTSVANEPHALFGTNTVTLLSSNIITASVVVADQGATYVTNVDYWLADLGGGRTGMRRTMSSTIPDGATVFVNYDAAFLAGLSLTITGNVEVATGGTINVSGRGYGGNTGTGNGGVSGSPQSGAGAGHGGYGGISSSNAIGGNCYGVFNQPVTLGSGGGQGVGGAGGNGGGAIKLIVGGSATIDGIISANGADATNSRSGGGSGGSIWITAQTFSGSGTITAHGGNGEPIHGGGGGGGRISVQCGTNDFTGIMAAYGGLGWKAGGAGTVYTQTNYPTASLPGMLVLDNGGRAGTNSLVTVTNQERVSIRGNAGVTPGTWISGNVLLCSNSFFVSLSFSALMTVNGDFTIESGAGFLANGKGSPPGPGGTGQGASSGTLGGGGGHGGWGGPSSGFSAAGGAEIGNETAPTWGGGGGGNTFNGGSGGGMVRLTVQGNLHLDGSISVNGTAASSGSGGGGAGGGVNLTVGGLSGSGSISANGGNGISSGGGGGGGRIAIYYSSNSFSGTMSAIGGDSPYPGGAGTIFLKPSTNRVVLVLDNGGRIGARTPFGRVNSGGYDSLTVVGGATATYASQVSSSASSMGNLFIGSNSWFIGGSVSATGLVTIQATGGFNVDASSGQTSGPGLGGAPSGGGGYGGYGGHGTNVSQSGVGGGGLAGGSLNQILQAGSPGYPSFNGGGFGGGIISIAGGGIGGGAVMILDGILSANGGSGTANVAGGGSGGSIRVSVRSLSGTGRISANGGNGRNGGGGGGGGRVAIFCDTNNFLGSISAYGGTGHATGGAGTVYFNPSFSGFSSGAVLVDNNQQVGTNTYFGTTSGGLFNLTIQNGGRLEGTGTAFSNILIHANSWLMISNQSLTASNLTIDAGGGITADGRSSQSTGIAGPNRGSGHGGYGARGTNVATAGGQAYGSITEPISSGSYSGIIPNSSAAGGGGIKLTVTGNLLLNGRVSADAAPMPFAGFGGASGGSVWLNVGTLSGSGLISANGGDCINGGGGGGGRIAIYYRSNSFTGNIDAQGGAGFNNGGAGTIYTKANNATTGWLLLRGSGLPAEPTPLSSTNSLPQLPFDLIATGGALPIPLTPLPVLSNLWLGAGSSLTMRTNETNLVLSVLNNVTIEAGASLDVTGKGFAAMTGSGAGASLSSKGAGGGYGGTGGNSQSGAAGGVTYGSAIQPVDRGSGGGTGANTYFGGSEGGGAVILNVGGTLNLAGSLNANGNPGLQDDSGGGSGGSIWISAGAVNGNGAISAKGGNGDLFGGGGGGGGRIAIYSPANSFIGSVSVSGGMGANAGQPGTLFLETNLFTFAISGRVTNATGQAVTGVLLQPSGGLTATTTDLNGNYTLGVPYGWTGTVMPALGTNMFVPGIYSYSGVVNPITDRNHLMVGTIAPSMSSSLSGTNLSIDWVGIAGVTYQPESSTNLVNWLPYGPPLPGANGGMQLLVPTDGDPLKFVRLRAIN